MPKTPKAPKAHNAHNAHKNSTKKNKTVKCPVEKGLKGGRFHEEVMRFISCKFPDVPSIRSYLLDTIGRNPDGSLKRGTKKIGPFRFTVIPMNAATAASLPHYGGAYIKIHYDDNSKDYIML